MPEGGNRDNEMGGRGRGWGRVSLRTSFETSERELRTLSTCLGSQNTPGRHHRQTHTLLKDSHENSLQDECSVVSAFTTEDFGESVVTL